MNVTETAPTIAALQSAATHPGAVAYLTAPGREGTFIWRSGNFVTQIAADPYKGIFLPSSTTMPTIGCWVRDWDGTNGRPEWFGARPDDPDADNRAAITACFQLCPVTQLGAHDYYVRGVLVFSQSNRAFIGAPCGPVNRDVGIGTPGPMGRRGGTRVILAGPQVVSDTVFQFGKLPAPNIDNEELMRNSVLRDINFCRDNGRGYKARNSVTDKPSDSVKGIICSGLSSCRIEGVASFDSPVGWHCFGCVYTKWDDCAAWRSTPAPIAANDFSVGFLIGDFVGHSGYAGANASVYFNRCICYDIKGGSVSVAMRIYGAVSDTFLTQIEVGRCDVGIEIDGRGHDGRTMPLESGLQQDIHIINPIIDQTHAQGLQLRNLNRSFQVSVVSPYIASAGELADIHIMGGEDRVEGQVSIVGGVLISEGGVGLVATDGEGISIIGTLFRNYRTPLNLTNCRACRIEPDIYNHTTVADAALRLKDIRRSSVKPIVRAPTGVVGFLTGIDLAGGEANSIDPTMVDFNAFADPTAARKVVYNRRDARSDSAFHAAGNVLVGVIN